MINLLLNDRKGTIAPELYSTLFEDYGAVIKEGVWVGEKSSIPNEGGYRLDTIEAFRELGMSVMRFPGGTPADYYRWRDGIGPRSERPRTWNFLFGGEDTNEFGTDEFLQFCEAMGVDACIKLNPVSASLHEALDWMQYCNYNGNTTLANLRRKNGHPEPYGVKYWIIGNECADAWSPEAYAEQVHQWTFFIRQVDPKAKIIPTGWNDEWNERFVERYSRLAQKGLLASNPVGLVSDDIQPGRMIHMLGLKYPTEERIQKTIDLLDGYLGRGTVDICVEEWCAMTDLNNIWPEEWRNMSFNEKIFMQGQTHLDWKFEHPARLEEALIAAEKLHLFMRYANRIKMTSYIYATNAWAPLIRTDGPSLIRTPLYHVFHLLKGHLAAEAISVELEDAEQLDVIASISKDERKLTVSLLNNQSGKEVDAHFRVKHYEGKSLKAATATVLTGEPADENTFESPDRVRPQDGAIERKNGRLSVTCMPGSLTVVTGELTDSQGRR